MLGGAAVLMCDAREVQSGVGGCSWPVQAACVAPGQSFVVYDLLSPDVAAVVAQATAATAPVAAAAAAHHRAATEQSVGVLAGYCPYDVHKCGLA